MEKSELKSLDCLAAGTERDSKLFSVLNSSILRDFFMGHNLPWKEDVEDGKYQLTVVKYNMNRQCFFSL